MNTGSIEKNRSMSINKRKNFNINDKDSRFYGENNRRYNSNIEKNNNRKEEKISAKFLYSCVLFLLSLGLISSIGFFLFKKYPSYSNRSQSKLVLSVYDGIS